MTEKEQQLHAVLADLEDRLDEAAEQEYAAQWIDFLEDRCPTETFTPARKNCKPPKLELPQIHINDAIADPVLMLTKELTTASAWLATPTMMPSVRMNYGTGILSSMLGAEIFAMPYQMDTLPTTRVIAPEQLEGILEKGVPDLNEGFGKDMWQTAELYLQTVQNYPKVAKLVDVYHPDLQGPLDIAELMLGSDVCYMMYDEPEKLHAFLRLITDTYICVMEKWQRMFPPKGQYSTHWGCMMLKGQAVLRADSGMNLSPDFYREFSMPYDAELLRRFDGGVIHFCGRGDHYIDIAAGIPGLCGINMSQPEYNDMEKIFANTVDKNIKILAYSRDKLQQGYCRENGVYHGNLHLL